MCCPRLKSEEELTARTCITDVLTRSSLFLVKFETKEQEMAVESMLMNQSMLIVLPTAYGKS